MADVPRLTAPERRTLSLHRAVASKLAIDPDGVLRRARENLKVIRRADRRGHGSAYADQWEALLDGPLNALLDALVDTSQAARDLRQSSPFAGVLFDDERLSIIRVEHEREIAGTDRSTGVATPDDGNSRQLGSGPGKLLPVAENPFACPPGAFAALLVKTPGDWLLEFMTETPEAGWMRIEKTTPININSFLDAAGIDEEHDGKVFTFVQAQLDNDGKHVNLGIVVDEDEDDAS